MPWPADSGIEIGQEGYAGGLPQGFEPSGAVWHSVRQTLLVVDDSGLIAELVPDHGVQILWELDEDLEGITLIDPLDGLVYLAVEDPDGILEFDLTTGSLTGRNWDLTPWLTGPDNHGLEALTWVDGHFYAGLQEDGNIFVFDLLDGGVVQHLDTIFSYQGRDDISGLHYDSCTETLFAIYDSHDVIVEMDADGEFRREFELTGDSQEGVALIGESTSGQTIIFIAEDAGEVWRYTQYPVLPCGPASLPGEVPPGHSWNLKCRPNPFNPRTELSFESETDQAVSLIIYDLKGQVVEDLIRDRLTGGTHQVNWNGCSRDGFPVASGIYFARISAQDRQQTVKLILAR